MSNKRRRRQREDNQGGATDGRRVACLECHVMCSGDVGSLGLLQAEGMPHQAEAEALERGAHQSGSQLSPLLANSWAEEIKGRGVISLSERVNVLC